MSQNNYVNTAVNDEQYLTNPRVHNPNLVVRQGGRLSRKDAAAFLGFKPATLKAWSRAGSGPRSVKVGNRRFYDITELVSFSSGEAR